MHKGQPLMECKSIYKTFPGVKALENIDFSLYPGEIHGLVGENGAGKSTLVKILAGVFQYDDPNLLDHKSGMYLLGRKVIVKNPSDAIKQRIMMIHQELNVIPDLSVYENIFLNNEISRFGFIDRVGMISETQKMIDAFDVEMKPSDIVKNLSVDKQKLVEVLKAISQDARVLIMDEPTSVLLDAEAEYVFKVMKNIVEKGIGIVFISHNLGEIVSICDRVTVLRDGKLVAGMDKGSFDTDKLVSVMVGKRLADLSEFGAVRSKSDEMMLEIHGLRYKNLVRDVSFAVKKGEIVGITGLVGSGGTELAKTIFGAEGFRKDKGVVYLKGRKVKVRKPSDAIRKGIALLTKDRKNEGLFLKFNLSDNICIPSLKKFLNSLRLIDTRRKIDTACGYVRTLAIKTPGVGTALEALSGGNQQKVVLAKWLETMPEVLIMDEPMIGIDIGAKSEIRKIIRQLADQGKSIILITNEYSDLQKLCSRVFVMFKGELIKELDSADLTEEVLLNHALGGAV